MTIDYLKSEIDLAFKFLGAEKGFEQNVTDIKDWKEKGIVNEEEYHELRKYNRVTYYNLPLDA